MPDKGKIDYYVSSVSGKVKLTGLFTYMKFLSRNATMTLGVSRFITRT